MMALMLGLAALAAIAALGLAASNRRRLDVLEARIAAMEARAVPVGAKPAARRVDPAAPAASVRPTLIEVPNLAAKEMGAPPAPDPDGRFAPIRAMAEAGASAEAIARETGQPIGQVELILGLDRSRPNPRIGQPRGARPR